MIGNSKLPQFKARDDLKILREHRAQMAVTLRLPLRINPSQMNRNLHRINSSSHVGQAELSAPWQQRYEE